MSTKRTSRKQAEFPSHWQIFNTFTMACGTVLEKGDDCKVNGERGTYRFNKHVIAQEDGKLVEWVTLYGGNTGQEQWRSVYPNQIKAVKKKLPRRPRKKRTKASVS